MTVAYEQATPSLPALFPSPTDVPVVVSGHGVFLVDQEGRQYLDGSSGAVAANLGHGSNVMAEALAAQARAVAFAHRSHFRNEPAEELAALVADVMPGDIAHSNFASSGSEANETAMRFALAYWEARGLPDKRHFVTRRASYHGSTLGALSLTGSPSRRARIEDLLYPYAQLHPQGGPWPDAATLAGELSRLDAARIAAVVIEPVGGASGPALVPREGYHAVLREWCDANDVLWIADEVMCGFGRTGRWFAVDHDAQVPDMVVFGKGVSGGYAALAGVAMTTNVAQTIAGSVGQITFGHTYTNTPLAAAVGVAAIGQLKQRDLVTNARERGEELSAGLSELAGRHPVVRSARGRGLLQGLELHDPSTGEPFPNSGAATTRLLSRARTHGLVLYPGGKGLYCDGRGDGVMVAPPLVIDRAEVQTLLDRLDASLQDLGRPDELSSLR